MSFTPLLYSSVFFQELAKILPTLFSTAAFIMKRNESYILKHGPLEDCRCPTKPCSVFFWRDNTAATFNHVLFFILKKLSQSKTNLSFVIFLGVEFLTSLFDFERLNELTWFDETWSAALYILTQYKHSFPKNQQKLKQVSTFWFKGLQNKQKIIRLSSK